MNKELLERADSLWDRADRAMKFQGQFELYPYQEGGRLLDDFQRLSEELESVTDPVTQDEVYGNELKRRLSSEALHLDHFLSGHYYTLNDVIDFYRIEREDVEGLRGWLVPRREEVLETIDRLYQTTEVEDLRRDIRGDIPETKRNVEGFAAIAISDYRQKLNKFFGDKIKVGRLLADITAVPTTIGRSYFDMEMNLLALDIGAIFYVSPNRTPHVNHRQMIRLFGHEGMGHGLTKAVTDASSLPGFLKRNSEGTRATIESVGQHFEEIIFDDLRDSPKTLKALEIHNDFNEIYQTHKDAQLVDQYHRKLFLYAISVLANKELGDMSNPIERKEAIDRRIRQISEVALFPGYAISVVERQQNNFDSQGNLSFGLAQEMVYAAQPVQRVLNLMKDRGLEYAGEDRDKIDMVLLAGFWTPIGLVENAQVAKV